FSGRRRHTRSKRDWSSDVCSSDLKTLRTSFGDVKVSVPRDRKGEFEPQVLKKGQTSISQDVEEKILSMYAKGMTTSDIEAHIQRSEERRVGKRVDIEGGGSAEQIQ